MVATGFDTDEWELLLLAPWTIATGIVQADPSGSGGRRRELDALTDQIRMAQAGGASSELVRAVAIELVGGRGATPPATRGVVDDGPDAGPDAGPDDGTEDREPGDLRSRVLARCGAVADVLEVRASQQEAQAFKAWLLELAAAVAEAAREGGVLGITGARVSDEERAMLGDLAHALRSEG